MIARVGRSVHRLACALIPRARAAWVRLFLGVSVSKVGCHVKFRGLAHLRIDGDLRIGDFCWIEAVTGYGGQRHSPQLRIGRGVAISDLTHLSCVMDIDIGEGCLLGSKIYIGDHSHGSTNRLTATALKVWPARRLLADAAPIKLGAACWIGDGAVILAGTRLAEGSIVAANSVVRLTCDRAALIAGVPARVVRFLESSEPP